MDSDYAWQQQQLTKTKEVRVNDPFARRPCQPTPLAFSKDPPNKETPASVASPQKGTAAPTPVPTPPPKEQKVEHDDPYSIHNELDLDLDIDVTGCCFFCFFFVSFFFSFPDVVFGLHSRFPFGSKTPFYHPSSGRPPAIQLHAFTHRHFVQIQTRQRGVLRVWSKNADN